MTMEGCGHLEFDMKSFGMSSQIFQKDKESSAKIGKRDNEVRTVIINAFNVFEGTKADALAGFDFRNKLELKLICKQKYQKFTTPPETLQQQNPFEIKKISDKMILELGFGLDGLAKAVEMFELSKDPDFIA